MAPRIAVLRFKAPRQKPTEVLTEATVYTLAERPAHLRMETIRLGSYLGRGLNVNGHAE